ncbi:MAG: LysR substrate-binding domain-containing protein [Pseudomonadota bacterium]
MSWHDLPPLTMLRAFEAAARTGGFTAAGRELNVTHAAIAQQVRALEERLGVRLMRREGRGLALTPEAQRLAERLGSGFETLRAAIAEIGAAAEARPVCVTLTTSFSSFWLMPRIGEFRACHPDIELLFSPTSEVVDLARGEFDLAIRFGHGDWPGLSAEALVVSSHVVVSTPDLLARHPVETPTDLLHLPWVQENGTDEWRIWLAGHGIEAGPKRDVHHMPGYMALAALREGQGIGLVARVSVAPDLAAGRLVALFETGDDGRTGYHLVRRPGAMRANVATFVAWLRREAGSAVCAD